VNFANPEHPAVTRFQMVKVVSFSFSLVTAGHLVVGFPASRVAALALFHRPAALHLEIG
jgi:hypothetical protein